MAEDPRKRGTGDKGRVRRVAVCQDVLETAPLILYFDFSEGYGCQT
jgi:hypothetical protein